MPDLSDSRHAIYKTATEQLLAGALKRRNHYIRILEAALLEHRPPIVHLGQHFSPATEASGQIFSTIQSLCEHCGPVPIITRIDGVTYPLNEAERREHNQVLEDLYGPTDRCEEPEDQHG